MPLNEFLPLQSRENLLVWDPFRLCVAATPGPDRPTPVTLVQGIHRQPRRGVAMTPDTSLVPPPAAHNGILRQPAVVPSKNSIDR